MPNSVPCGRRCTTYINSFLFLIKEDAHVIQAGIQWGRGMDKVLKNPSSKLRHLLKVRQ